MAQPPVAVRPLRLLVVSELAELPGVVHELTARHPVQISRATSCRKACEPALLSSIDAVLICDPTDGGGLPLSSGELQLLADALASHRLSAVIVPSAANILAGEDETLVHVSPQVSVDELWGRLAMIRQYQPLLRRMEEQVTVMQRLGKRLNQHFVEVDQELRLASRLQRDFLPKRFPDIHDIRFGALYRPATWVSGDVYDVRRLDETHVSFCVADAVGHGVAAGLLTMFIRQAVVGKHISNDGYTLIEPGEVLAALNAQLAQQELPNCQFVTACYGIIDVAKNAVTFARGGHPHPIHVTPDGACAEVRTVGGLLGVFPDETFPAVTLQLEPGSKLVVYSDGLEDAVIASPPGDREDIRLTTRFLELLQLPAHECAAELGTHLDRGEGSLAPADDQTCLIIERLKD